jgi:beta-mannanase
LTEENPEFAGTKPVKDQFSQKTITMNIYKTKHGIIVTAEKITGNVFTNRVIKGEIKGSDIYLSRDGSWISSFNGRTIHGKVLLPNGITENPYLRESTLDYGQEIEIITEKDNVRHTVALEKGNFQNGTYNGTYVDAKGNLWTIASGRWIIEDGILPSEKSKNPFEVGVEFKNCKPVAIMTVKDGISHTIHISEKGKLVNGTYIDKNGDLQEFNEKGTIVRGTIRDKGFPNELFVKQIESAGPLALEQSFYGAQGITSKVASGRLGIGLSDIPVRLYVGAAIDQTDAFPAGIGQKQDPVRSVLTPRFGLEINPTSKIWKIFIDLGFSPRAFGYDFQSGGDQNNANLNGRVTFRLKDTEKQRIDLMLGIDANQSNVDKSSKPSVSGTIGIKISFVNFLNTVKHSWRVLRGNADFNYGLVGSVIGSGFFLAMAGFILLAKAAKALNFPRFADLAELKAYQDLRDNPAVSAPWHALGYEQAGQIYLDKEALLRLPKAVRNLFIQHEEQHKLGGPEEALAFHAMYMSALQSLPASVRGLILGRRDIAIGRIMWKGLVTLSVAVFLSIFSVMAFAQTASESVQRIAWLSEAKAMASRVQEIKEQDPKAARVWAGVGMDNRDIPAMASYFSKIGARVAAINLFQDWSKDADKIVLENARQVIANGAVPIITWEPWKAWGEKTPQVISLKAIAAREYDTYIINYAKALKALGQPVILRWGHEFNVETNYPWAVGQGNSARDYKAAYIHIHNLFTQPQVGANNVIWMWSPNVESHLGTHDNLAQAYPGSRYVDVVGVSVYNLLMPKWREFDEIFGPFQAALARFCPDKPVILAELGTSKTGGDAAQWWKNFRASLSQYPRIKGFLQFEANVGQGKNFRLEADAAGYRDLVKDSSVGVTGTGFIKSLGITRNGTPLEFKRQYINIFNALGMSLRVLTRLGLGEARTYYGFAGTVIGGALFIGVALSIVYAKLTKIIPGKTLTFGSGADLSPYRYFSEDVPGGTPWQRLRIRAGRWFSISYEHQGEIYLDKNAMLHLPVFVRSLFLAHEEAHRGQGQAVQNEVSAFTEMYLRLKNMVLPIPSQPEEVLGRPSAPVGQGLIQKIQTLQPGFGERQKIPGKLFPLFLKLNSLGITGLLFPVVSSMQITGGHLQANPTALTIALAGVIGLLAVKTLAYAWANSGKPVTLTADQRQELRQLAGLEANANLRFGTISETRQGSFMSRVLAGSVAEYQGGNGQVPTAYLADGLVRTLFELGQKAQWTPWERIQFGVARAMAQSAVNRELTEWAIPQVGESASILTQVQNSVARQLTAQALEKGVGVFAGLAATSGILFGALVAVIAGVPVMAIAATVGLFGGVLGLLYAFVVERHYNNLEAGEKEAEGLTAEVLAGDFLNGGKYQVMGSENVAADVSDLYGAVQNMLRVIKPVWQVPDVVRLMSDQKKSGFGKELSTLVEYIRNNTFEADSPLAQLQQTVIEAGSLSGEKAAVEVALLQNAALASLLSAASEVNVQRADITSLADKRVFIQNAPEAFATLARQVETALQEASTAGIGNLQDLQDLAEGLRALSQKAQGEAKGKLMLLDKAITDKLMPFILGYDQKNTQQQFADFGQDYDQKSAVVTEGYTMENMTTVQGEIVQVPVPRVLELTSRKPVSASEWRKKVQEKEAKAAGYYQSQVAALQAARQPDAISSTFSRLLAAGAGIFGGTFIGRALNTLALDLNHEAYMLAQAKSGQYRSSIMQNILKNKGSGLQTLIQRRDLNRVQFQKQMLSALIRVLDANPQDITLLQDVIDMMNRVAPSSGVAAGKIQGKNFMLPNILAGRIMYGRLGKMLGILRGFPQGVVELDDNVENIIKRQIMRSVAQAA